MRSPTHWLGVCDAVHSWAARTGLPLTWIGRADPASWDLAGDRGAPDALAIGLAGDDLATFARIPDGLWDELEDVLDLTFVSGPGVFRLADL